ncbi:MAG: Stp1/IreP family PP2C-type Ser/Thr phosphatase [Acidobacteria bacterium]|nr:Stp1/IreP family PP2C-type Ser/Thr phosphatase [Acidobacteriota bacterium]
MHIRYGTHTDRGRIRTTNEDSYAASARNRLFLVADGMGGHAGGEIASSIAAATVEECVALRRDSSLDPAKVLQLAVAEANARIYDTQTDREELAGMGSTITALAIRGNRFYLAHVGDSRGYLLRGGQLRQLTRDHSLVWRLYENGELEKKDLSSHPKKNLITRSIGPHSKVDVDTDAGEVRGDDVFLICSDGLTDVVTDEMLARILSDPDATPQELSLALVDAANDAGGPDNVTVVVVRIEEGEAPDDDTGRIVGP